MSTLSITFEGQQGDFQLAAEIEAPSHGVTALFGPSGSGKTTILRAVAGLTRFSGHCHIADAIWQDDAQGTYLAPHHRAVGYVFQEASLFPHLSVTQNLRYGAERAARRGVSQRFAFEEVVEMIGLVPLLGRSPLDLSGGERQRVAIGRALLAQPAVLLMDEPLSALDRQARTEILPYLERLHRDLSVPLLYVSHDLPEVARLADYLVVLENGRVVEQGPLASVLERLDLDDPEDRFETGVVVDATVRSHDEAYQLTTLDLTGNALVLPRMAEPEGQSVRLRIRARDVALATQAPEHTSVRNILPGAVAAIEQNSDTPFAEVLVQTGEVNIRARITRASAAELKLTVGMQVYALIKSITFERRGLNPHD